MIRTIRHKGLKRIHEDDDPRGLIAEHADKLRDILSTLHAAPTVAHAAHSIERSKSMKWHRSNRESVPPGFGRTS